MSRSRERLDLEKEKKDSRKGSRKQPSTPTPKKKTEQQLSTNPSSLSNEGTEYSFEELANLIRQTALEEKVKSSSILTTLFESPFVGF
jgi:hypothetical protein